MAETSTTPKDLTPRDSTLQAQASRPERVPPRNQKGQIICEHPTCQDRKEIFRRPCEWNKHMDKHERPYKCNDSACEQNLGFTYSGGLLRHLREVHKIGLGPTRKPLYCPHNNCVRSQGEGFTRRENLEEHLRRRHSHSGVLSPASTHSPRATLLEDCETSNPRKRRRTDPDIAADAAETQPKRPCKHDEAEDESDDEDEEEDDDVSATTSTAQSRRIQELEAEILRQKEIITRQEQELDKLRTTINSLPSEKISNGGPASLASPALSTVTPAIVTAAPQSKSQSSGPKWTHVLVNGDNAHDSVPKSGATT